MKLKVYILLIILLYSKINVVLPLNFEKNTQNAGETEIFANLNYNVR